MLVTSGLFSTPPPKYFMSTLVLAGRPAPATLPSLFGITNPSLSMWPRFEVFSKPSLLCGDSALFSSFPPRAPFGFAAEAPAG